MGFFSKAFKKIKKGFKGVFKGIGKGLKSAFAKFGKFMGKIGIVGQLALSFMLPGVGAMLAQGFNATVGAGFTKLTGALAKGGKFAQTAGKILESGAKFAKAGTSAFKTVTDGVSSFLGEFTKTALKKIPGMETMFPKLAQASDSFFVDSATGKSAWGTVQAGIDENIAAITESFNGGIEKFGEAKKILTAQQQNVVTKAQNITGKGTIPGGTGRTGQSLLEKSSGGIDNVSKAFEDFKPTGEVDFANMGDVEGGINNIQSTLDSTKLDGDFKGPGVKTIAPEKSLLSKAGDFIKDLPENTLESVQERVTKFKDGRSLGRAVTDEALEKGIETVSGVVNDDIKTQLSQEMGIIQQPEYFEVNAPAQYMDAGTGSYVSPEINDRALQMGINPTAFLQQNTYGYGANIYEQQMRVKAGGSTAYG